MIEKGRVVSVGSSSCLALLARNPPTVSEFAFPHTTQKPGFDGINQLELKNPQCWPPNEVGAEPD